MACCFFSQTTKTTTQGGEESERVCSSDDAPSIVWPLAPYSASSQGHSISCLHIRFLAYLLIACLARSAHRLWRSSKEVGVALLTVQMVEVWH